MNCLWDWVSRVHGLLLQELAKLRDECADQIQKASFLEGKLIIMVALASDRTSPAIDTRRMRLSKRRRHSQLTARASL